MVSIAKNGYSVPLIKTCFISIDELSKYKSRKGLLGIILFDDSKNDELKGCGFPSFSVNVGSQNSDYFAEVWQTTADEVQYKQFGKFRFAFDGHNLFGCISFPEFQEGKKLEDITEENYTQLFQHIRELGYPYLYRMWNYIPKINEEREGLERYRSFCLGRSRSFEKIYQDMEMYMPAATGIAKNTSGSVDVYFLAHKYRQMTHLENPRQTPAYRYPRKYGPKPPSFARATYIDREQSLFELYVSGTASIIGSQSCYLDDAYLQVKTTLENIEILVNKENLQNYTIPNGFVLTDLDNIKIYYRNISDFPVIKEYCERHLSPSCEKQYINVDICRADLLVEIEASILSSKGNQKSSLEKKSAGEQDFSKYVTTMIGKKEIPLIDLPVDSQRKKEKAILSGTKSWRFSNALAGKVIKKTKELNVELQALILHSLSVLLYRYSSSSEIFVLTNKGIFAAYIEGDESFSSLIGQNIFVQNADFSPSASLLDNFQIRFDFVEESRKAESEKKIPSLYNNCELCIFITKNAKDLSGNLVYNANLYNEQTISRLISHWTLLLEKLIGQPDQGVGSHAMLSKQEVKQINNWNSTEQPFNDLAIPDLFEQQAAKTPHSLALSFNQTKWTYSEVNEQTDRLALELQKSGVTVQTCVGVFMSRSANTLLSILSIWKAGGTYVPLDTTYPPEHINHILEQTETAVIMMEKSQTISLLNDIQVHILYIEDVLDHESEKPVSFSRVRLEPTDISSIFYTSGSTGNPKGVIVEHRYHVRRLSWSWEAFPFSQQDIICQRTTVNFVVSMWEYLAGLLKGIPTVVLPDEIVKDPLRFLEAIRDNHITYILVVPSLSKMLAALKIDLSPYLSKLRFWVSCGEPIPVDIYEKLQKAMPDCRIVNQYGASEVYDVAFFDTQTENMQAIKKQTLRNLPVGRPIGNTKIHIVNEWMQRVPVGVTGEIYIDTPGMARGYVQLEEETAQRFIDNPFSNRYHNKLYKMGDLGRYLPDGCVEILGRKDNQVKIRGIRIELEGIESRLRVIPGVLDCAVLAQNRRSGVKRLVAYIISPGIEIEEIRGKLEQKLPPYMMPSLLLKIDKLPRKPNGKLDRQALLQSMSLEQESRVIEQTKPLIGTIPDLLKDKIAQCFEIRPEDVDENIPFMEMGADSVVLVDLVQAVNQAYQLELRVSELFNYPTINELSHYLAGSLRKNDESGSEASCSHTQNRLMPADNGSGLEPDMVEKPDHQNMEKVIAVVGMSGKVAGTSTINEFWELLVSGRDSIGTIPSNRWDIDAYYDPDRTLPNKSISKWGGFLKNADEFDPLFFNISPGDAEVMDPQQRLFLEECWQACEDAGITAESLSGKKAGVFAGVRSGDYQEKLSTNTINPDARTLMGNDSAILAARTSYFLNLKGPCISIDTACSSSLVAIHLACQSIQMGECELAFAGGVHVQTTVRPYITDSKAGMLSWDGKCKTFDNDANGFVPGEAVGVVILKPLDCAVKDGDRIYGLIRGTGINQDGKTNGITAPSSQSQTDLIESIYKKYQIDPESINYIEAHGTGTKLGDPIEVEGLTRGFQKWTGKKQFCALGSVKTNVGHTVAAAGIVSLIKVLLALKHKQLPASLNCTNENDQINFSQTPFYVNKVHSEWKTVLNHPRRAGISSFGFSGTNAHIVVEEFVAAPNPSAHQEQAHSSQSFLHILSAKTKQQLHLRVEQMKAFLEKTENINLADLTYTLQVGRSPMKYRLAFMISSKQDLIEKLGHFLSGKTSKEILFGHEQQNGNLPAIWEQDGDARNLLKLWYQKQNWSGLAGLWINGLKINWKDLYGRFTPRKMSLPNYPFAREKYWVTSTGGEAEKQVFDSVRVFENKKNELVLSSLEWTKQTVKHEGKMVDFTEHLIVLCGFSRIDRDYIQKNIDNSRCLFLLKPDLPAFELYQTGAAALLKELKELLISRPAGSILVQLFISSENQSPVYTGLAGMLKTAGIEYPKLVSQIIELDKEEDILAVIKEHKGIGESFHIKYKQNVRYSAFWEKNSTTGKTIPWKDNGVYVITGGLGGVGYVFAREIAGQACNAVLIIIGRSELDRYKQKKIDTLRSLGVKVEYFQADVGDNKAISRVFTHIKTKYSVLNGILHCAGIIRDSFLIKKTDQELENVFAPKVRGTVNLDTLSKSFDLDFFILCSSISSVYGNTGQADYAGANGFLDQFSCYRSQLVEKGERSGKTLSVIWPLWQTDGMQLSADLTGTLFKEKGLRPLPPEIGICALYHCFALDRPSVMVQYGDSPRFLTTLKKDRFAEGGNSIIPGDTGDRIVDENVFADKLLSGLTSLFSEVSKLNQSRIDIHEPLESYGLDSIMVTSLNQKLAGIFHHLSKTIFYEFQTLREVALYLSENHRSECMLWIGDNDYGELAAGFQVSPVLPEYDLHETRNRQVEIGAAGKKDTLESLTEPIAIIGLSGCYPHAHNVEEFWENLKNGKDCIGEIPSERWSLQDFYEPDVEKAVEFGKSYSKWGGFLQGFADFDPLFFSISPIEALKMDPQERLFVKICWEVLEDAGYTRARLTEKYKGNVGVFAGITKTGYELYVPDFAAQGNRQLLRTSFSSVANRVSYLFNFTGPSIPIDTMCSSSLTAVHEACEHIRRGECEVAVAGGVNLYVHPLNYIELCSQRMLSRDGKCRSFGKGGNGFVPGEGVGAVFLKRESAARKDNDHIYGIIRSSRINHGGKTNGYTVPNPAAQSELIRAVYQDARIKPGRISYIEAHGTGTELGDPIEITGLNNALGASGQKKGFCALGSVKSNIGHLEAAAGIAGLTKILLQLQHKQLVPTLHAEEVNPNIDFKNTPFYLQKELMPWKTPTTQVNGREQHIPRIAGISSFGAGGSNAHVIIEEYIEDNRLSSPVQIELKKSYIIPLSARKVDQVIQQANRLLAALKSQKYSEPDLVRIAFTLQTGRESMEERVAFIVSSLSELMEKLAGYVSGKGMGDQVYSGNRGQQNQSLRRFYGETLFQEMVNKLISQGKHAELADLWICGFPVDWIRLYGKKTPLPISLPTYPFSPKTYWIPEHLKTLKQEGNSISSNIELHPLVHRNTSDFMGLRYSSVFTGRETFLRDHQFQKQRVMPGVAYLEMARAAIIQTLNVKEPESNTVRLRNLVWIRPIILEEQPATIHISLGKQDNNAIRFEVYSDPKESSEPVLYFKGHALITGPGSPEKIDISLLKQQCDHYSISSDLIYQSFDKIGLNYGPSHKGVKHIYGNATNLLARLVQSDKQEASNKRFFMHPGILDAAFQASIGFSFSSGQAAPDSIKPSLPFALDELIIYDACSPTMWAYIKKRPNFDQDTQSRKLDIDLCNEEGSVCLSLKGFSSRQPDLTGYALSKSESNGILVLGRCWKKSDIFNSTNNNILFQRHFLVFCELEHIDRAALEPDFPHGILEFLHAREHNPAYGFTYYAKKIFEKIQNILSNKPGGPILFQLIVPSGSEKTGINGIAGLLKTAHLENPNFIWQIIEVEAAIDRQNLISIMKKSPKCDFNAQIRFLNNGPEVEKWEKISLKSADSVWKNNGIYLITGAGGLGFIFAKEISTKVKQPVIIFFDLAELDTKRQSQLEEIRDLGALVEYMKVDITDYPSVVTGFQKIRDHYGKLNGILHTAGIIRDNFIILKSPEEFGTVLAPKVAGTVNLDRAAGDIKLDFFVLFSSAAGALGNSGQSDYAAANAFMDYFASYRNNQISQAKRFGQTISINWPLWQDGGMHVDAESLKNIYTHQGFSRLSTLMGLQTFYQIFTTGKTHLLVLSGNIPKIRQGLEQEVKDPLLKDEINKNVQNRDAILSGNPEEVIKDIIGRQINLDGGEIENNTTFEKYGIDSIVQMNVLRELEKTFGTLTQTLLFEYPTISELVAYFVNNHGEKVNKLKKNPEPESTHPKSNHQKRITAFSSINRYGYAPIHGTGQEKKPAFHEEDIAIIGISGRYPLSDNLEQLWEHLKKGDNCVTPYPRERWENVLASTLSENGAPLDSFDYFGGVLSDIYCFDHKLFEIEQDSVLELSIEQRLFLEVVWETFEKAGYTKKALELFQAEQKKGIGVFVGSMYSQYAWSHADFERARLKSNETEWQIANRISHFFNLTGPSLAINSACSSSLTAIHLACESLKLNNCSMAIAGGINLTLEPSKFEALQKADYLGSGNQSKSFGAGDGYIPGEGVGAVLLKPLSKAVRDADRIDGVIKSSFINHSGGRQMYTAPDPKQQTGLILESIKQSGLDPGTLGYVESAANGSKLGDAIEIIALKNAFSQLTDKKTFCALGSVKSNVGHLEAASGISQLSKVILQMRHKSLVPSIHAHPVNENIKLDNSAFYLQEKLAPWHPGVDNTSGKILPLRSMINSFGAGGSFANLIVEEYVEPEIAAIPEKVLKENLLFLFSAKTESSLRLYLKKIVDFITVNTNLTVEALAYSLYKINHNLDCRTAIVAPSLSDLKEKVNRIINSEHLSETPGIYQSAAGSGETLFEDVQTADDDRPGRNMERYARIWASGGEVDCSPLFADSRASMVWLPTYAFDHNRVFRFQSKAPDRETETDLYQDIIKKISQGQLSEYEFEEMMKSNKTEV